MFRIAMPSSHTRMIAIEAGLTPKRAMGDGSIEPMKTIATMAMTSDASR